MTEGQIAKAIILAGVLTYSLPACEKPAARDASTAADMAAYTAALEDCLQQGKAAKSRAVYRECADGVERKWGGR